MAPAHLPLKPAPNTAKYMGDGVVTLLSGLAKSELQHEVFNWTSRRVSIAQGMFRESVTGRWFMCLSGYNEGRGMQHATQ